MHAVVNLLQFREPVDRALFVRARDELLPAMKAVDGFESIHVVQTSPTEAILVILADSAATLDRLATEVGSPWMSAHVVPLMSGPPARHLGEIIMSSQYA